MINETQVFLCVLEATSLYVNDVKITFENKGHHKMTVYQGKITPRR